MPRFRMVFGIGIIASGALGAQGSATAAPRVISYGIEAKAPARWTLGSKPVLEFGGAGGTGPTEFTNITGVTRQSDGTIVVAEGATRELRFFSPRGEYLHSASRGGGGPGELRQGPNMMVAIGDTLVVGDGRTAILVFAPNGKFLRSLILPVVPGYIRNPPVGALSTWDAVIYMRPGREGAVSLEFVKLDTLWLFRVSLRDTSVLRLLGQPSAPLFAIRPGEDKIYSLGYAPQTINAIGRGRICTGYPERYEVLCSDSLGRPLWKIVRDVLVRPVSDSARWAYRNNKAGRRPDGTSQFEGSLRQHREEVAAAAEFADHYPAYSRLMFSRTGELWVRSFATADDFVGQYSLPFSSAASSWSIYDAQGVWIGDCTLPARFAPGEIGTDYVLGVSRDENDVERVTLLSLRR